MKETCERILNLTVLWRRAAFHNIPGMLVSVDAGVALKKKKNGTKARSFEKQPNEWVWLFVNPLN